MLIDPTVHSYIEKFVALAKANPDDVWREFVTDETFRYVVARKAKRFVRVHAGSFSFLVDARTGGVHSNDRRRKGPLGNIADFIFQADWRRGHVVAQKNGLPIVESRPCSACGSTSRVLETKDGRRCSSCREISRVGALIESVRPIARAKRKAHVHTYASLLSTG